MRAMLATLVLLAPLLAGCAANDSEPADVMATFYPLAFLAEKISNGTLRVDTLVPAGMEPHDWEPSAADLARAGGAKVFLAQGGGFEPWLPGLRDALGNRAPPLVYTTSGLPLREGAHDDEHGEEEAHAEDEDHAEESNATHNETEPGHEDEAAHENDTPELDPHTWLDPVLFGMQAERVESALVNAFPDQADALRAQGARLREDLDALHAEYEAGLGADCETRTVIANHDAYGYLAARYDLTVVAISGLSPEAEPSPQDMARAVDAAREHNVTIIFFEETVSDNVARAVANEVGAQTRVLSPVEVRPDDGDYFSRMRANLDGLREAMRCA